MLYLILAILMFGVLIAVHEFGHFITAKWCGVKVNEFAIGMGPAIIHKTRGETEYSLRAFPIGGYCAMEGEDEETDEPRAFSRQSGWKKFIILVAGSVMNLIAGIVIILILYAGVSTFSGNTIASFAEGFPGEGENGLMVGDSVVQVDGHRTYTARDFALELAHSGGTTHDLVVIRNGERVEINDYELVTKLYENEDGTQTERYGIDFATVPATVSNRLFYSMNTSVYFVKIVWYSLEMLVTGQAGLSDLSGPVGIVSAVTEIGTSSSSTVAGVQNVMYFMAMIAINLAIVNLLPLPALDGGRIFFLIINAFAYLFVKKQIPAKYESMVHFIGFALLMGLMIFVTLQDVFRIVS